MAILCSKESFAAVRSKTRRCLDFATISASILSSPLTVVDPLHPDKSRYSSFDSVYRVSLSSLFSVHSPCTELHGMLKDCVPFSIILVMTVYLRFWLGMLILRQNSGIVRTKRNLLLVAPNLHLSLNGRSRHILFIISFGKPLIVSFTEIVRAVVFSVLLMPGKWPLSGCTGRLMPLLKSICLYLHPVLEWLAMKQ